MDVAMFQTPFVPPERGALATFNWAVDQAIECDRAGFTEYWIGEHATQSWESIPNPELVISAAARETSNIKLAPGAHLLPYHHPASLAIQIAYLTQVLEGRYILGVGAGAYPADGVLRGVTDLSANHEMMVEALDIMQKVWAGEPFQTKGKFWNAGFPVPEPGNPFRETRPYGGSVTIGMTGLSPSSASMKFAGSHGYLPLSIYCGDDYLKSHWETYSEAAAAAGLKVDRSMHHVVRDVFIADTDKEAKKRAIEGGLGRAWREYLLPAFKRFHILEGMIRHPGMDVDDIDVEYLADHVWIVGSPETAIAKFQESFEKTGGWGTVMVYGHDYIDDSEAWNESLRLLASEVAPKVSLHS